MKDNWMLKPRGEVSWNEQWRQRKWQTLGRQIPKLPISSPSHSRLPLRRRHRSRPDLNSLDVVPPLTRSHRPPLLDVSKLSSPPTAAPSLPRPPLNSHTRTHTYLSTRTLSLPNTSRRLPVGAARFGAAVAVRCLPPSRRPQLRCTTGPSWRSHDERSRQIERREEKNRHCILGIKYMIVVPDGFFLDPRELEEDVVPFRFCRANKSLTVPSTSSSHDLSSESLVVGELTSISSVCSRYVLDLVHQHALGRKEYKYHPNSRSQFFSYMVQVLHLPSKQ
ncbi:hypothetical protein AAHA92_00845 [Salvia divinorum]|uniref:Uncharacterized protein n=1 Tax=Salvia divinorum TaxID=28513 RepID=A0ABD1IKX8_SALDI